MKYRLLGLLTASIAVAATAARPIHAEGTILAPASERFAAKTGAEVPDFQKHLLPVMGRLGCNGRACHGSFQGQGGFQLSLFGYDIAAVHTVALRMNQAQRMPVVFAAPRPAHDPPLYDRHHCTQVWR